MAIFNSYVRLPEGKLFNWCKDHVSIPESVANPWKKTTNTWRTWKKSPANMATAPMILFGWWLVWNIFLFFDILRRITPTDEPIFFRGVGQPPTRYFTQMMWNLLKLNMILYIILYYIILKYIILYYIKIYYIILYFILLYYIISCYIM